MDDKPLNDYPFENMAAALENLTRYNIVCDKGMIKLPYNDTFPPEVLNAVDYLCDEWDCSVEMVRK